MNRRAVVWSIAGLDSGGGAGLSADQRAADALGVHLCPVAAALTAQNSVAVEAVLPVPPAQLAAQLDALEHDLPPDAVKTGLLGSVENVRVVAERIDRLRRRRPVPLVVDPVLGASSGATFADASLRAAYRELLLPRATVVTPNLREAARLAQRDEAGPDAARRLAEALRGRGAGLVCVTGGDVPGPDARDFVAEGEGGADGWLVAPRRASTTTHGTGCLFATAVAAGLGRGFRATDSLVMAKMATASGLRAGASGPGAGPGPVRPEAGWLDDPASMPWVLDRQDLGRAAPGRGPGDDVAGPYAIASSGAQAAALFEHGVRWVQLRLKRGADACGRDLEGEAAWRARLDGDVTRAMAAARASGGTLVLNDHLSFALDRGIGFVHLGQEDLDALDSGARERLRDARARGRLRLGVSSHSPWELARARGWAPDYIACGPVWPTTTKAMPWRPQGLDQLRWWVRVAGAPVVAIGGITTFERLAAAARCGAAAGAMARALAGATRAEVAAWRRAWEAGRTDAAAPAVQAVSRS